MSPPTKPTTSIADLPPEMICELFKHLNPMDLIACSMVNKRWHALYSGFKVHRLAAIGNEYYPLNPINWRYPDREFQENELCPPMMLSRFVDKPLLSNLKYLALGGDSFFGGPRFDPNVLNKFRKLLHLEINIDYSDGKKLENLNLPSLRVLVFGHFNYAPLSIDCPELSVLAYFEAEGASLLKVKHPETIRKLETNMFGSKLARFKGVECLVTKKFEAICKRTLLSLPRLKELRHNVNLSDHYERHDAVGTFAWIKRALRKFMDDVSKLREPDFRFRFAGFQLTKTKLDEIDFGVEVNGSVEDVCNEYVYMKNYQLIDPDALDFLDYLDYGRFVSEVTWEIPVCFSKKFTSIQWVTSHSTVQDANHLLRFLKSLRSLRRLRLWDPQLSQEFYDQLPASAPLLNDLGLSRYTLSPKTLKKGQHLNFDFIRKLSHLSVLLIEEYLSVEQRSSLVRSVCKLGSGFCFRMAKTHSFIHKIRGSKVSKIINPSIDYSRQEFASKNPEQIVNYLEEISS